MNKRMRFRLFELGSTICPRTWCSLSASLVKWLAKPSIITTFSPTVTHADDFALAFASPLYFLPAPTPPFFPSPFPFVDMIPRHSELPCFSGVYKYSTFFFFFAKVNFECFFYSSSFIHLHHIHRSYRWFGHRPQPIVFDPGI